MFVRSIALACGFGLLAASAKPITLPGGRGAPAESRPRTYVYAPAEGGLPDDAAPEVVKTEVNGKGMQLWVGATVRAGRAPVAVLQQHGTEVARISLRGGNPDGWGGTFDVGPGDYRLTVKDGASELTSEMVTARVLPCYPGERRLVVREVEPAQLRRSGQEPYLDIPRWYRADQEFSFVVEWLREGKLVYETSGRTHHLEDRLGTIEFAHPASRYEEMCAYDFGESYRAPKLAEGTWQVRVHREGAPSVTATFEVRGRTPPIALALTEMPTPAKVARRVAHIPAACTGAIRIKDLDSGEQSWRYGWDACEDGHSGTGNAVPATAAEYRALVRGGEPLALRQKMDDLMSGDGPIDRPDFEYDSDKSPDTNWRRKKAWEQRDSERQFANERTLASRARAKYGAALAASVKQNGGAWRPDEIPAPLARWPAP